MKKLLYILTMLFNAIGSVLSMSLFIFASSFSFANIFLVLSGCIVFITSLTITILDYNNVYKQNNIVYTKIYKPTKGEVVINNYKDYFISKKTDFIVA